MAEEQPSVYAKTELAKQQYVPPIPGQYLVCQKKRNNPRIDVKICKAKCDMKETCREWKEFENGKQG